MVIVKIHNARRNMRIIICRSEEVNVVKNGLGKLRDQKTNNRIMKEKNRKNKIMWP